MRWLRLVSFCLLWLSWASPAFAHTVVLLRQAHSHSVTELLERLRGELLSVGFEVIVRDRPAPAAGSTAAETWQRALAADGQCEAAIDVIGEPSPSAVDVWIIDSARTFQLLARVEFDDSSKNAAKDLAIRASEVLRARVFETRVDERAPRPRGASPSPRAPRVDDDSAGSRQSGRVGFELGAAALASLDGVGPAILPLLRVDWAIESKLALEVTLAGLGTRPSVASAEGNAQLAMQYGLLGACYRLDWDRRVQPLAALSFGALRTSVVGQAEPPRAGHSVAQWSFLADASLGAAFWLSSRYAVTLAAHAQLAEPYVAIHFGDRIVASSGRPNLSMTLTFGVWP